jgi:DNA-binding CsgD family transcriptional regulator/ligand-binding sensor domain-containing protein
MLKNLLSKYVSSSGISYIMKFLIKNIVVFLFFIFWYNHLAGATLAIKNFPKSVYNAANQNWSVAIGHNGFIYFANHKGLLEFDGVSWRLMQLPHETIIRAVYVDDDGLIYTAGYRELGFWKENDTGKLEYHSLNELAEPYFSQNDEFWTIARLKDKIYFQSFGKILEYDHEKVVPVKFTGFVNTMKRFGEEIIVAIRDKGLYKIENNETHPFLVDPIFENTTVKFILPLNKTQMLIGTSSKGIYLWDSFSLKQWNQEWTPYFINNEVNRAYLSPDGRIVIGSIIDGIVIFDHDGTLLSQYNTGNGLQNNTVLGIAGDIYGNLWLSLDNGIAFLSADKNYHLEVETVHGVGSVYDIAFFEGKMYLGTNQGLFVRDITNGQGTFELVPETQGQVWFCRQIDDFLFVGFNGGLLTVKNSLIRMVSDQAGGFCIKEDPLSKGHYVLSTYNNLVRVSKDMRGFSQKKIIPGFFDLIRYIEFDHRENLWASHMHRGVYKLQLNSQRDSVVGTTYYGQNSPFGKDHNIHVFKIENRIVFTTGDSLFTYDDISDTIVPYNLLNLQTGIFATAHRIIEAPDHHYWFITRNELGLFRVYNNVAKLINVIPRVLFKSNGLIDDFENVYPTSHNKAVLCLENGIVTVELPPMHPSGIIKFKPVLREITLSGPRVAEIDGVLQDGVVTIKYKHQNIRLRYSFPHYTHFPISFRSMLKGIDSHWKENLTGAVFNFDRLPEGTYEFMVKAVDPWGNESQQCIVKLEVLPPFYMSSIAKAGYFIMALVVFFGLQAWAIKRTKKNERLQLEKREQELIRLRNEKLSNEIGHKSKELANLTMAIIKKNEFLMNLKEIFAIQKEQLGSRYPDKYFNHVTDKIDDNISNTDDWNLFETNFERAHEQFLQKLKGQFPGLTPKDLRLCAFLRMNLASKEIAPLMGISVRGVENHRYRIRKKMGLDHDDNLIEMILKL